MKKQEFLDQFIATTVGLSILGQAPGVLTSRLPALTGTRGSDKKTDGLLLYLSDLCPAPYKLTIFTIADAAGSGDALMVSVEATGNSTGSKAVSPSLLRWLSRVRFLKSNKSPSAR